MPSIYKRKDGRWVAQFVGQYGKDKYLYARKRKDVIAKLDKALEAQTIATPAKAATDVNTPNSP